MTFDDIRKLAAGERIIAAHGIHSHCVPALCNAVDALLAVVYALPRCDGDGAPCGKPATWSHRTCDHHRYRADGLGARELPYAAALRALLAKEPLCGR